MKKYTPEQRKAVVEAVADGVKPRHISRFLGISEKTIRRWIKAK